MKLVKWNVHGRLNGRSGPHQPPADWHLRVVILWQEDECLRHDPDAESLGAAFRRITGRGLKGMKAVASHDYGDCDASLHDDGWVVMSSYCGGSIGVLVVEDGS